MISLTDRAATQLQQILKTTEAPAGSGLRLYVERGGCAGLSYAMKIGLPQPGDEVVDEKGARVIVEGASLSFLRNSEVDYVDTLSDTGFKIHNPNAARSCGCGTSFEPAQPGPVAAAPAAPDGTCRT